MDDLISRLSEIRGRYNCFDESEEPYYRALSEAIKVLSRQADGDTISRREAIDALGTPHGILYPIRTIEQLPSAQTEVTEKQVCEYCRRRNLVMITNESFEVLKAYYERRNA